MSGNEQLKLVAERWVFYPVWSRDRACRSCNQYENPARVGELEIFIFVKLNLQIVQFELRKSSCQSL